MRFAITLCQGETGQWFYTGSLNDEQLCQEFIADGPPLQQLVTASVDLCQRYRNRGADPHLRGRAGGRGMTALRRRPYRRWCCMRPMHEWQPDNSRAWIAWCSACGKVAWWSGGGKIRRMDPDKEAIGNWGPA